MKEFDQKHILCFCLTLHYNVTIKLLQGGSLPTFRCGGNGTGCCPSLGGREASPTRLAEVRLHITIVIILPRSTDHTCFSGCVISMT